MKAAHPYLNFDGNAEEVFNFYKSVFGGEFSGLMRYGDMDMDMGQLSENDQNKVAHVSLPLGQQTMLMGTDILKSMGHSLKMGNNFSITLEVESSREADRIFEALSAGGNVEMALEETAWAEKYGKCDDKYGVSWMVNYAGSKAEAQPVRERAQSK